MSEAPHATVGALFQRRSQIDQAEEEIVKAQERVKNAIAGLAKGCWHPQSAREQHNWTRTWEPVGGHGMSERSEIMCDEVCSICGKKLSTNPLKPTTKETPNK